MFSISLVSKRPSIEISRLVKNLGLLFVLHLAQTVYYFGTTNYFLFVN